MGVLGAPGSANGGKGGRGEGGEGGYLSTMVRFTVPGEGEIFNKGGA